MFRRITTRLEAVGTQRLVAILASRAAVHVLFMVAALGIAAQAIHAREYGGFVGARPLLASLVTSDDEADATEEVIGAAATIASPAFRAASVHTPLTPTVLSAEAIAPSITTSTATLVQPILTDLAAAENGRAGIRDYVVVEGDVFSTIAEKFGISTSTILWENKRSVTSVLRPGERLRILPIDGVTHVVAKGNTLESIAKRYHGDAEDILEYNDLVEADDIAPGDLLIIPGGRPPTVIAPPVARPAPVFRPALPLPSIPGKLLWPSAAGYRISQYFTWRHHGIDIAIPSGTPVFASDPGTVVSSGWMSGYGYQVTIDHGNGLKTRYAHNSRLLIAKGATVGRGDTIALVGSTGRSTGPHIHYEVFANGVRVNPFQYLR